MCQVIENDKLDQGYKQLKAVISQHRPDLIPVSAECAASPAAPVTNVGPVLLLGLAGECMLYVTPGVGM